MDTHQFEALADGALQEETIRGRAAVRDTLGKFFTGANTRLRRLTLTTATIATATLPFVTLATQAQAMSKQTADYFKKALLTQEQMKNIINTQPISAGQDSTQAGGQQTPAENDSTRTARNARLEELRKIFLDELQLGMASMSNDFMRLVNEGNDQQLRVDAHTFQLFANQLNDENLKAKADSLVTYIDNLVGKRIVAVQKIQEANQDARYDDAAKLERAKDTIISLLDECKDYKHLTFYVYTQGVIPLLGSLQSRAEDFARRRLFDDARKVYIMIQEITSHESIKKVRDLSTTNYVDPVKMSLASIMCDNAKDLARQGNIDGAETILNQALQRYPGCDSLVTSAKTLVAGHMCGDAKGLANTGKFEEARRLLKDTRQRFSGNEAIIAHASAYCFAKEEDSITNQLNASPGGNDVGKIKDFYNGVKEKIKGLKKNYPALQEELKTIDLAYGTSLRSQVFRLVEVKDYESALRMLEEYEKYAGNNDVLRRDLARKIVEQSKMESGSKNTKRAIDWSNKFVR